MIYQYIIDDFYDETIYNVEKSRIQIDLKYLRNRCTLVKSSNFIRRITCHLKTSNVPEIGRPPPPLNSGLLRTFDGTAETKNDCCSELTQYHYRLLRVNCTEIVVAIVHFTVRDIIIELIPSIVRLGQFIDTGKQRTTRGRRR